VRPTSELEVELSRLRQENAKLKLEKEILKNHLPGKTAAHMGRNTQCLH
jgi:regulator of replication initiation timing